MAKSCNFLRLINPSKDEDGICTDEIIRTDSIVWVSYADCSVFIQFRAGNGDVLSHLENYDSKMIAKSRFYMILDVMGAYGQLDVSIFIQSMDKLGKWTEVK